jgi:RNA polymerase sigma-70 factor (ECF subfamily)
MEHQDMSQHLSRITTMWSMVFQAHGGQADAANAAQRVLMQRYNGAIYRYLLAALRNPDAADELSQEFALRFVRGDFRRADPERGRFRDFIKRSLYHLIVDYHRQQKVQPRALPSEGFEPEAPAEDMAESDRKFLESWRDELLARAWEELKRIEDETGQPFHMVLRFRAAHPSLPSPQMAEQLSTRLGKPLTAAGIRQTLHRAREKFATLLVEEVERSLEQPNSQQLEQELIDLDLMKYCQLALERRSGSP